MKVIQKEQDTTYYLNVESHYKENRDAKGQSDAVMFEAGNSSEFGNEIDTIVTCSVEQARAFAQRILQVCEDIEGEGMEKI